MADEYRYDPDNRGTQGSSGPGSGQQGPNQQGYNYRYNYKYSYNAGKGTAPFGGGRQPKPPQQDNGSGDWIGIAVLFLLPTGGITQIIAVIWLIRKLMAMDNRQKQRYRQEAQKAASTARSTVADLLNLGSQMMGGADRPQGSQPGQNSQRSAASSYQDGRQQAAQPQQEKKQPEGPARQLERPGPVGGPPAEGPSAGNEGFRRGQGLHHRRRHYERHLRPGYCGFVDRGV